MAGLFSDLDMLREIPGYQAIMKGVVKSLIQILIEQLSAHTGEESVILTASINDGTLSHLGSESGKVFLEENEEFKTKFLGFCLKRQHRKNSTESHSDSDSVGYHPSYLQKVSPGRKIAQQRRAGLTPSSPYTINRPSPTNTGTYSYTEQPSFKLNETVVKNESSFSVSEQLETTNQELTENDTAGLSIVKQEPDDEDIEITGVDPGVHNQDNASFDQSHWSQNTSGGNDYLMPSADMNDGTLNMRDQPGLVQRYIPDIAPKIYYCDICNKAFDRSNNRNRHRKTHSGERPHTCSICGKNYTRSDNLRKHLLSHIVIE